MPSSIRSRRRPVWGRKRDATDLITAKLPALHFYQLAMPVPKAPAGSFDADGRAARPGGVQRQRQVLDLPRAADLHRARATTFTRPRRSASTSFQANRGPERRYVTTPLRALFDTQKIHKGGFYHDGRFADARGGRRPLQQPLQTEVECRTEA